MKVSRKGEDVINITIDGDTRTSRTIQIPWSPHHKRWQMRDRNQDKDWYG